MVKRNYFKFDVLRSVLIFAIGMIYSSLVPPVLKHPVYVHVRVIAADLVG